MGVLRMASAPVRNGSPALTRRLAAAVVLAAAPLGVSCRGDGPLARFTPSRAPHEAYAASLEAANLHTSAAGEAWMQQAARALQEPRLVMLPLHEAGYFEPTLPAAAGYRFDLPRGRALAVTVTFETARPAKLFIDLFRVTDSGLDRVASADDDARELRYVSRADGAYVLRLQPELLGGGRYTIEQLSEASLRFPVQGVDERAIQSVFGDARDGGRRDHHGVDIFAPRGTPVIAAADGIVRRVDTTDIGGKVVWLYDRRQGQSLYYAHLNDWAVREGQEVEPGTVLGYVGNTGNARSTPPHLHFGIYSGGPVDPLPFIRRGRPAPAPPAARDIAGRWARTLRTGTAVHVRAAWSGQVRVTLPDGTAQELPAASVVPLDRPLRIERLTRRVPLLASPAAMGIAKGEIDAGELLAIFAVFEQYALARTTDGRRGWVRL